jgi:hypothetical protein
MTFQFSGTIDPAQKFVLTYTELDKNIIINQLSRDEKWYRERHQGWTLVLNKLIDSINKEGLKYPLCIVYKNDQYICTHGGQRLAAALKSKLSTVPCIIAWRDWDIDKIPINQHIIQNMRELVGLNSSDIDRVHLSGAGFEILVHDRKGWDPNDYEKLT